MSEQINLKPCPLCGSKRIGQWNTKDGCTIKCYNCGIKLEREPDVEWYEQIESDLYRKHPYRSGLEVAADRWNTRKGDEE